MSALNCGGQSNAASMTVGMDVNVSVGVRLCVAV